MAALALGLAKNFERMPVGGVHSPVSTPQALMLRGVGNGGGGVLQPRAPKEGSLGGPGDFSGPAPGSHPLLAGVPVTGTRAWR